MTPRADQLAKLRENLKDFPLTLVPDTMTSVKDAFNRLRNSYGDPQKLVNFQLKKLENLPMFPNCEDGSYTVCNRTQAEWLLSVGTTLDELVKIIDDGTADGELKCCVLSPQTSSIILEKFPSSLRIKLIKSAKENQSKPKLVSYRDKLAEWAAQALDMEKYEPRASNQDGKGKSLLKDQANVFNPPQPLPNCVVCSEVQKNKQVNTQLLHLSNHATGCPSFIEMSMDERVSVRRALNLCQYCLQSNSPNHETRCMVLKKKRRNEKSEYTCKNQLCYWHMWLCSKHKHTNKDSMENKAADIQSKAGYQLVHLFSSQNLTAPPTYLPHTSYMPADSPPPVKVPDRVLKVAAKKLRKSSDGPVEVVPIPDGAPMFMYQPLRGKTKPVNAFYDSGCSNACIMTGIPGAELSGQVIAKGPFVVEGVNSIKIEAKDEWLVHLDRADGRKQLLRGVTLDTITADSPMINIEAATKEVKDDKPDDAYLQSCCLPTIVGGPVHILIGNLYNSIFPEPIHHLPSGLTVYRCVLASHDGALNATIGGPHSSFGILADQFGGAARLMAHFLAGLEKFKKWGPPSIETNPVSLEELQYAKLMNSFEDESGLEELVRMEKSEEYLEDLLGDDDSDPSVVVDKSKLEKFISETEENQVPRVSICECDKLCEALSQPLAKSRSTPGLSELISDRADSILPYITINFTSDKIAPGMNFKLLEDGGLNIEYRCVRCRDCADCRNAEETEKTSLREEAEMVLIKASVKLDLVNRKIVCSLPTRGPERDFLSTNKDRALTILDQQCRKYHKDDEVKEIALKAFSKLFDNGHAAIIDDVDPELLAEFIDKDPQYYIPWRLQFNLKSLSTPCRAVLDGSSRTKFRPDGTGGRCLNDLVVKGKITTINLLKMLLRFCAGLIAVTTDLQQFYNACKLLAKQWNLQRFLYRTDMDPANPVLEGVIMTLIYGIKSVSAQSEHALKLLADHIREKYPEVAQFLEESRYVDDEGDSKATLEEVFELIAHAEETFGLVGLKAKEYTVSVEVPTEKVSKDGASLGVGGTKWFSKPDLLEVPIPPLHFSQKKRGKLDSKVEIFGSFGITVDEILKDLDEYVPKKLTRRMVTSKKSSIFDILGKLVPNLISSTLLLRETLKSTLGWDDPMSTDLRNKWLKEFLLWEQLRGIQFTRAMMPVDACDSKMRLIIAADAAKPAMIIGTWAGFKRTNGTWSCNHLLGRSLLTPENSTIPKDELTAFTAGSNMAWMVRNCLKDWVESFILIGDSMITLCWVSSDRKRLSLFHKNRVIQVRRGTPLENMFHVTSENNPADIGTRPDRVTLDDTKQDSKWISGLEWMRHDIQEAVESGILKPVADVRLNSKEEEDRFHDGCVFDTVPEVLTRGHVLNQQRISLIQKRASFSKYILLPTKYGFRRVVRIYSYLCAFAYKLLDRVRVKRGLPAKQPACEGNIKFSMFTAILGKDCDQASLQNYYYFAEFTADQTPAPYFALAQSEKDAAAGVTEKFINTALTYLYRKAATEVKEFNSKKSIDKISVEQDQVLISENRLVDGMRFAEMGDLNLPELHIMGVKAHVPILDRYSPLSYSIAKHVHDNIALHRGIETCNRFSLQHVFIMQGMSLYKEVAVDCIRCAMKKRKLIEVTMGPISDHQLSITPPFWCCQVDLFGPMYCYVPGYERNLRTRTAASVQTWILVSACPVTKLVNAQVVEKSDASGILDAVTRLCCEIGVPSILLADSDSALVKAIRDMEVTMVDLKLQMFNERGIRFELCSVGGHNEHGLVERSIQSIQGSMEECGLSTQRLTATGLQTLCKLIENDCNNLPIGFKYDRDQDNTEVLKILTPNMMRHGRINSRSLSGPLRLPHGASEMAEKVLKTYEAWYKVWSDSYIPKLLFKPKWYKSDVDLKVGDIVYFKKEESKVVTPWVLGMVDSLEKSKDGLIRKVLIKYRNASESQDRFTRRNVRTVCKIWSEDDWNMQDDMAELQAKLKHLDLHVVDNLATLPPVHTLVNHHQRPRPAADGCCCKGHCQILCHGVSVLRTYQALQIHDRAACDLSPLLPRSNDTSYADLADEVPVLESSMVNLSKFLMCTDGLPDI